MMAVINLVKNIYKFLWDNKIATIFCVVLLFPTAFLATVIVVIYTEFGFGSALFVFGLIFSVFGGIFIIESNM